MTPEAIERRLRQQGIPGLRGRTAALRNSFCRHRRLSSPRYWATTPTTLPGWSPRPAGPGAATQPATTPADDHYQPWITELRRRIPANGTVLDLGCGCGAPLARSLANTGYAVTGVDLSDIQIRRARQLIPSATFIRADATTVDFPTASFDVVVCLYALIHMPLDEQPPLMARIATWLKPGGWFLATTGHQAWTGTEDNWLGGAATMWWSHADTATYRSWITHAGLIIQAEDFIPEDTNGHSLFLARRPPTTRTEHQA